MVSNTDTVDRQEPSDFKKNYRFARLSRNLIVINPYLDPRDGQNVKAIEVYLDATSTDVDNPPSLTLHYGLKSTDVFHRPSHERAAKMNIGGVMRSGQRVECFVWRKPPQGSVDRERFHDRFIISELGGIGIQIGAGAGPGNQQTSVYFLSDSECRRQLGKFDSSSPAFELLCRFHVS